MELGKHGKLTGQKHPRDLRRTDPEPPRATPKAKQKRKAPKLFAFSYEYRHLWWKPKHAKWVREYKWFKTETARDQSMRAFERSTANSRDTYRDIRAESVNARND